MYSSSTDLTKTFFLSLADYCDISELITKLQNNYKYWKEQEEDSTKTWPQKLYIEMTLTQNQFQEVKVAGCIG